MAATTLDMLPEDRDLEQRINTARWALQAARTHRGRHRAWQTLRALIAQRSPQQIAQMEVDRGLRS